jgi:hypothetical protein
MEADVEAVAAGDLEEVQPDPPRPSLGKGCVTDLTSSCNRAAAKKSKLIV